MKTTNLLWSTAYHEAGHAVIAITNKISVSSVSIKPGPSSCGRAFCRNPLSGRKPEADARISSRWRMERESKVLLAGVIAERKFEKSNKRRRQNPHSGVSDNEKVIQIVSYFCGADTVVEAYIKLLYEMTVLEVDDIDNWNRIQELANILINQRELSRENLNNIKLHWGLM